MKQLVVVQEPFVWLPSGQTIDRKAINKANSDRLGFLYKPSSPVDSAHQQSVSELPLGSPPPVGALSPPRVIRSSPRHDCSNHANIMGYENMNRFGLLWDPHWLAAGQNYPTQAEMIFSFSSFDGYFTPLSTSLCYNRWPERAVGPNVTLCLRRDFLDQRWAHCAAVFF